jgi:hypothetical protein
MLVPTTIRSLSSRRGPRPPRDPSTRLVRAAARGPASGPAPRQTASDAPRGSLFARKAALAGRAEAPGEVNGSTRRSWPERQRRVADVKHATAPARPFRTRRADCRARGGVTPQPRGAKGLEPPSAPLRHSILTAAPALVPSAVQGPGPRAHGRRWFPGQGHPGLPHDMPLLPPAARGAARGRRGEGARRRGSGAAGVG